MRWARFVRRNAAGVVPEIGVVQNDFVIPVGHLGVITLFDVIQPAPRLDDCIRALHASPLDSSALAIEAVRLLSPLEPVGDVIAIGRNYAEHAGEMARSTGVEAQRPTVFTKAQTSVTGPFDDIVVDSAVSSQVDWEVELAVIIGRTCRNVAAHEALDFVFGYTVLNDVSARDIQYGWGGQFYKGKSLDGYCPIGPWVVTADEIPDPQSLELTLILNGVEKQRGHTGDMIFTVAELVSQLSIGQTLRPGTVIATGTPAGVGYARTPKEFLQTGDIMESRVDGIGSLRNGIVSATEMSTN
jgi:2-keto-4-pentenoate hydratase/2-oxohepta-3-ene-1,7-dioic acid hydratase in catechol pathway